MDDGERKRRRIGSEKGGREDGDGDGADEEEKMETFFALIRSTKDVLQSIARESRERARLDEEERAKKAAAAWTPRFRLEDFVGDDKSPSGRVPEVQAGSSNSKEGEEEGKAKREKQKEDNDLELKLSL
ncbi:hypothetical protein NL676_023142 [Syzygium grande]|nr:hypothetical protein NL676_023142 [Syzygium grande]